MLFKVVASVLLSLMVLYSASAASLLYSTGNTVFTFDGVTDTSVNLSSYFQCVKGNNPRSISFMIKTDTTVTNPEVVVVSTGTGSGSAPYQGFQIEFNRIDATRNIMGVDANGAAFFPVTGTVINDNVWHGVAVTYDGTTLQIYIDGRLDNSATNWRGGTSIQGTMNTQNNNIFLGRAFPEWGNAVLWKGSLMNVNFYDYAITVSPPTSAPTATPSLSLTVSPSNAPTATPSSTPSVSPSSNPSGSPSSNPSVSPSNKPTGSPSSTPTATPSSAPSIAPSTSQPSFRPTVADVGVSE